METENAQRVAAGREEIVSDRLRALMDDILDGRSPNAGRFCGRCYQPLTRERDACPHCDAPTADWPAAVSIPQEVLSAHRQRRGREGLVVRAIAWGGLSIGVTLALVPIAFGGVKLWTVLAFFGVLAGFYLLSANLANSLGDALGYRWGEATFRRRWERFVARRDADGRME